MKSSIVIEKNPKLCCTVITITFLDVDILAMPTHKLARLHTALETVETCISTNGREV